MTAVTAEVVITTKLFRPSPRQLTVERKRLYDLLRQGNTLPLTMVVAPAGWGKSTLVADWLARDRVTAAEPAPGPGQQLVKHAQPPAGVYAGASGHQKIFTCRHKPG